MTLYCSVSSAAPAETHVTMGYYDEKNFYLDLTTATTAQKKIVTDFLAVIGKHITVQVDNAPGNVMFENTIVIPGETDLDIVTVDYINITQSEKTKVDAYIALVASLVVE